MAKTRREFSPEFKREAVALLESSGRPLMQVATEVGHFAVDAAKLAGGGSRWDGMLEDRGRSSAAAVAGGPGIGDHAVEA